MFCCLLTQPTDLKDSILEGVKLWAQVRGVDEEVRFSSLSSSELTSFLQKLVKLLAGLTVWFSEPFFPVFLSHVVSPMVLVLQSVLQQGLSISWHWKYIYCCIFLCYILVLSSFQTTTIVLSWLMLWPTPWLLQSVWTTRFEPWIT